MKHFALVPAAAVLLAALPPAFARDEKPETVSAAETGAPAVPAELKKAVVKNYAAIVHANYSDCLSEAKRLREAIRAFLKKPSEKGLRNARKVWTEARRPYLQSEVYRYYAGPIDDADGPEPLLNSWPMDELYIDAGEGGDGGIIANEKDFPEITPELIERLNLKDGEKNISCGWHAIEFLLWGQDLSADGPGDRKFTDYTTAPHAARRGQYLQACADLMVRNFEELVAEWAPGKLDNYRATFEEGVDYSIERILTGMIFLSGNELAGERLQVAYDTKEQEEEHSCFSDTTVQDMVHDALGVRNVYRGQYARIDGKKVTGKGIRDLALAAAPELVKELDEKIDGSVEKAKRIPEPFDQAILGDDDAPGRKAILALIVSCEDQAALLRRLAKALNFEIPEEAPGDIAG